MGTAVGQGMAASLSCLRLFHEPLQQVSAWSCTDEDKIQGQPLRGWQVIQSLATQTGSGLEMQMGQRVLWILGFF